MQSSFVAIIALVSAVIASPSRQDDSCDNNGQFGISSGRATAISEAFAAAKLVPEAIDSINPKVEVTVSYDDKYVDLGNNFTAAETANPPSISFTAEGDHDPFTTKYAIFFVDPDPPSPNANGTVAELGFYLQEAIWDASPCCVKHESTENGEVVTVPAYRAVTPLSAQPHRYTFLVYRQPNDFKRPCELTFATISFDLNKYVADKGLVNVGANYFLAAKQ